MREGIPHGVLMAGHWLYRPTLPVQVCSIDTLIARNLRPKADLIVIDEAHLATSDGYKELLSNYPDSFVVAVTATPWVDKGLNHIAETIVKPITMLELIDQGFLVPARYFAPSEPDLRKVSVSSSTKDYVVDELAEAMTANNLTGDIVSHWKSHGENRPTVCFAVNIRHSNMLVERFKNAGVPAEHVDAEATDTEREALIARLESGETKVICNVGILTTGVDIPILGAIIMARPTRSRNLFIQMVGRATRPAPGKSNFILLDHAGNLHRHGFPTDEPEVSLEPRDYSKKTPKESKTCKACFCVFRGPLCPECGFEPPPIETPILEEAEGELKEIDAFDPILQDLRRLKKEAKETGKKTAWVFYKITQKYGLDACKQHLPAWFIEKQETSLFRQSPFRGFAK